MTTPAPTAPIPRLIPSRCRQCSTEFLREPDRAACPVCERPLGRAP